jgi:16S rRNA (guanine1516-N2)-methyltransferase
VSPKPADYALVRTDHYLGLQDNNDKKFAPFYIDFLSGKLRYRSDQAGLKREMLARAMGKKPKDNPRIVDATAGLGRDSFILATLGFEVTLLERSEVIHALLEDALQRAAQDPVIAPIIARMHLIHADARLWLPQLPKEQFPDIIYLDPMFPEREKSASVKKEMVILQNVLENEGSDTDLFAIAVACSKLRVVVKRPRLAPNLSAKAPSFTLTGKSSRFDIYLV